MEEENGREEAGLHGDRGGAEGVCVCVSVRLCERENIGKDCPFSCKNRDLNSPNVMPACHFSMNISRKPKIHTIRDVLECL